MRVDSRRVAVLGGVALAALLALAPAVLGQPKPADGKPKGKARLAVLDFKLLGAVPEKTAGQIIADLLMVRLNDRYDVYERSQLQKLLSEHKLKMTDLVDRDDLAATFGKLKGLRFLVLGSIAKLGDNYIVTARSVDCETGKVGERAGVHCRSLNDLPDRVNTLLAKMGLLKASEAAPKLPPLRPERPSKAPTLARPSHVDFLLRLDPQGAKVAIDGQPVKSRDDGRSVRVRLEPGPHVVRVSKTGYVPAERVVEVPERPLRGLVRLAKGTEIVEIETRPHRRRKAEKLTGKVSKETDGWLWLRLHAPGAKRITTRLVPKNLIAGRTTRLVPEGRERSAIFVGQSKPRPGSLWLAFHDRQFCSAIRTNIGQRRFQLGAVAQRMKEQFGKVLAESDSLVAWQMPGGDVGVFAKDRNLTILSPTEIWEPKQVEKQRTELSAALGALAPIVGGISEQEIRQRCVLDNSIWGTQEGLVHRLRMDLHSRSYSWVLRVPACKPACGYALLEDAYGGWPRHTTWLSLGGQKREHNGAIRADEIGGLKYGDIPFALGTDVGRCALEVVFKEPPAERFFVQGKDNHVIKYWTNKKISDLRFP